jgi:diguanylate cyclase (GGDEF)-like protein
VVLLPHTDLENAAMLAEKARARIAAGNDDPRLTVTVTIGVAAYPVEAMFAEALLELVDLRMYEGKRLGRNRVVAATPSLA